MTRRVQFLPLDPRFPERLRSNAAAWTVSSKDHFSCFWAQEGSMIPIVYNETHDSPSALVLAATSLRRACKQQLGVSFKDTCRVGFKKDACEGLELVGIMGPDCDNWVMDAHLIDEGERRRSRIVCQTGRIVSAYEVGNGNPYLQPVQVQALSLLMTRTREPS